MRSTDRERGATPIEFAAGVGLLLIPMVFLVASFAPWVERQSMARVAAAEAARLVATSPTGAVDEAAIRSVVATIATNHDVDPGAVAVFFCPPDGAAAAVRATSSCSPIVRGQLLRVEVDVQLPAVTVPLITTLGEVRWTAVHIEQVDRYRSIP